MYDRTYRRVATLVFALASTTTIIQPAAASHGSLPCSPPESLSPLFGLLHSLGELAFLAGVSIGTLGFLFGGIALMMPGEEWTRKGKTVSKTVFIGMILLLSANMIVSYLISELGGSICS